MEGIIVYLDSDVMMETYDLVDMILQSEEMQDYLRYKEAVNQDFQIKELKKRLAKAKELYDETTRFGEYHPDFLRAKEMVDQVLGELDKNLLIQKYKQSEQAVEELLYLVSETLAHAVSTTILVPKSESLIKNEGLACTSGACNTCGLGGSCAIKVS